ncbi:MAG: thiosulfate oxidation carrier complex protein SoxZ [Halobacteria archaeon]|nr:thiosulfate oxidation carrier complex protein SoxZ [Halobacteria archaeon]
MANKMKIRAWIENDKTTVKAIIFHPMETGLRKDKKSGKSIPAHYITEVICEHNGKSILKCLWGPGVSKNPFFSFRFAGAKPGDKLTISWVDNNGQSGSSDAKIS